MTLIKIIQFLHLTSYLMITSQLLFYLVILADAQKAISLDSFIDQRKAVDALMVKRYIYIYYACLALSLAMVGISFNEPTSPIFISCVIAFVCLVADVTISQKANVPLNKLTNSYVPGEGNTDWEAVRTKWLGYVRIRGIFSVVGMLSLLIGLVLNQKV